MAKVPPRANCINVKDPLIFNGQALRVMRYYIYSWILFQKRAVSPTVFAEVMMVMAMVLKRVAKHISFQV